MQDAARCFEQAVCVLPGPLTEQLISLETAVKAAAEEVRLRTGRRPTLVLPEGEWEIPDAALVSTELLERVIQRGSGWSVHSVLEQICRGYLTIKGGHRLGICGTAVMDGGRTRSIRDVSSLNLRVARQKIGVAEPVVDQLWDGTMLCSTLILAPPGGGKTTLLRDLIRCISAGIHGPALRVAVADERGELAASHQGKAQMELGPHTDVLDGCPKAEGVLLLLRGMNPQVIAVDEITAPEDVLAMEQAAGCGASVLATAHARDADDLLRRPVYRDMLSKGIFQKLVFIRAERGRRTIQVREPEKMIC